MNDRDRLISLLKELFRFDKAELNFGIYKIMNYKKNEIKNFIENDLVNYIDDEKENLMSLSKEKIKREIEEAKKEAEKLGVNFKETDKYKKLNQDLNDLEKSSESGVNIYNDIYRFFKRYYDNGDFLSKRRYSKEEKYAIPYNGEEVYFYWANKDQYYVKTTEEFDRYSFEKYGVKVNFKVKKRKGNKEVNEITSKQDEEKYFVLARDDYFEFDKENKKLNIYFEYKTLDKKKKKKYANRKTQDDIRKSIYKRIKDKIRNRSEDIYELGRFINSDNKGKAPLEFHLYRYTTKNKSDYFIHKNLKSYLRRELDFFIKNEIVDVSALGTGNEKNIESYLNEVRVIKNISEKIIDFLAQIENFQRKLFEKKKLVMEDEYCLTLKNIPKEIRDDAFEEIIKNKEQINEWKELYDEKICNKEDLYFDKDNLFERKLKNLVVDTKHFDKEFKEKLISSFKNIDDKLDGLMINSENYQALNLINNKYKGKVKCIYIDPPYNTGNDDFIYKDNYKHSSWLSMMNDRLELAKGLLTEDGLIFISIDRNEFSQLSLLMKNIFGEKNKIGDFVWKKKVGAGADSKRMFIQHEYVILYSKNINKVENLYQLLTEEQKKEYSNPDNDPRGPWAPTDLTAPSSDNDESRLYIVRNPENGVEHKRIWSYTEENMGKLLSENKIWFGKDGKSLPKRKRFLKDKKGLVPRSIIDFTLTQDGKRNIQDLFGKEFESIDYPKPVELIKYFLDITSSYNSKEFLVLDFFAGSGTTAEAVIRKNQEDNKKRKCIQIEMGDHFYNQLLPRLKKLSYSSNWNEGKPMEKNSFKYMFKYQVLEKYDDTLNNIDISKDNTLFNNYDDYFIKYMLDYESRDSLLNVSKISEPHNYRIKITKNKAEHLADVDLIETFNYLIGAKIVSYEILFNGNRKYCFIKGMISGKNILLVWRNTRGINYEKDKDFIEQTIGDIENFDEIYINNESYIKYTNIIDEIFINRINK